MTAAQARQATMARIDYMAPQLLSFRFARKPTGRATAQPGRTPPPATVAMFPVEPYAQCRSIRTVCRRTPTRCGRSCSILPNIWIAHSPSRIYTRACCADWWRLSARGFGVFVAAPPWRNDLSRKRYPLQRWCATASLWEVFGRGPYAIE